MPAFVAAQTIAPDIRSARLAAPPGFRAEQALPPARQVARLDIEPVWDLDAAQQVPAPVQRAKVRTWPRYGPAEPRPPGTPATPRPGVP